ncbi:GEVED domain-containing protein [Winogradskyella costae]|uniref:GEVED domain-containing protein n=1 Tax=Winogradskyella costae TaxID=2697008 RepID=UPI0015CBBC77|nr:GEVED domain-containing protein [Winogradskyella costae]
MKKITLFLIMLGFYLTASAQYDFPVTTGTTNVVNLAPVTINLNNAANVAGVPASSSGTYYSFLLTADWSEGSGVPYSEEAGLVITTAAGSITKMEPPTTFGAGGTDTVITFSGTLSGPYDPTANGFLDIELSQSYPNTDAFWSNIVLTLYESPTCFEPSEMAITTLTTTTVDLTWNVGDAETAWNLEYNTVDFTPGNGEESGVVAVTGTPTTSITGLTESTPYFVYYQSDCGTADDVSEWVGPFTFFTGYCESLPTALEGSGISQIALGEETLISGGDLNNEDFTATTVDLASSINANMQITFVTGYAYYAYVWIDFNEDLVYDATELVFSGQAPAGNPTTLDASFVMPDVPLGTYNMRMTSSYGAQNPPNPCYSGIWGVTADMSINVTPAPSCIPPTALAANGIGANSAELSWSQVGTVPQWNIEIVTNGTEPTGLATDTGISNPYTATGLSGLTSYDYYVQADCGAGDLSAWTGPFTFTTLCDVIIPDYIQNFSDVTFTVIPECWNEADNGNPTTGPTDLGASSWTSDGFLNDGTTGAYKLNLYDPFGEPFNEWILSPQFDLTGGPFQVEFDFAITEWLSTTVAGTLGSDDVVQFLISNDNGLTWTTLINYDNTSAVPITGVHPVIDLTTYGGQTVQFAFYGTSGTVSDSADNDVFVDNFRVRGIPTCPEPTDLLGTNLSLTSTELAWTENGTATTWNIQYGEAGFALGDGLIIDNVTNPYILSGLEPDTAYEYYVQAICSVGDISSFNGPFEFFTGYCASIPTSNTGDGVNNASLEFIDFPSSGDVNYENNTSTVVDIFKGIPTNFEIEFGHTSTYFANIWIDFNDDLVFDDTELVFEGESEGGPFTDTSHLFDASFLVPLTAQIGEHRMRVVTTNFSTPIPCYIGTSGVTLDFTVNIEDLTCTLAEAEYTAVADCDTDSFSISVDILDLGDATSLEISNSFNGDTTQVFDAGIYQIGPFDYGTEVRIFVTNEQNNDCTISSSYYQIVGCPPVNDNPCGATVAVVNDDILCEVRTSGTIFAGTPSGIPDSSCGGSADDDVWFQFVAESASQLISLVNIAGSDTNIGHSLYEGTCDSLVEIACAETGVFGSELSSATPQLIIGNTYYIRIFSVGTSNEDTTFEMCITPYVAPVNLACDLADNYCSGSDTSDILYTYNTINQDDGAGTINCLFSTPNPTYSVLEVGTTGDLLIEMVQNTAFDENDNPIGDELDVDFALWGPYAPGDDLCELSTLVDCSFSAAPVENVTLTGAVQGEIYLLLITNFAEGAGVIQVRQTNVGQPGSGSTIADINASIVSNEVPIDPNNDPEDTDEVSLCGFNSVTLQTNSPFADDFVWTKDGSEIPGENLTSLVVTESGNYQVQAFDSQCNSNALSQVVIINLYNDPDALAPQNITECDGPEADGSEQFDLDALSTSLGLDGFTITYYTSTANANQLIDAVESPYTSTGETLIMRIEDTAAFNNGYIQCRELSEVELVVNARPVINQPDDFVVCDDLDGVVDGETIFDLASINADVTSDANMIISYHSSLDAAEAGTGALADSYSSQGETIYVRAQDPATGCYETTSFALVINLVPLAEFDLQYDYIVCPPPSTATKTIGIVPTNFTDADVTVDWTLDGIDFNGSGLTLTNVVVAGEYAATITFNNSGCSNTITQTVEEAETCIFPEGISPGVSIGQNDSFDLSSFGVTKLEIFNRNGTLVYSKNNYTNEWVGQTNDGDELPVGTYFYTVVYEGGAKSKSAWVYINR